MKIVEMKVDKTSGQFNTYRLELSYSQLIATRDALRDSHTSPLADEMLTEIDWYLDEVPRPGEDKDKQCQPTGATEPGNDINLDSELPDPDGGETAEPEVGAGPHDAEPELATAGNIDDELPEPEE